MAVLVSAWEVRGSTFSIAFAVIPLSAWIAKWRQQAETSPTRGALLRMVAAWLISVNAIWSAAAEATSSVFEPRVAVKDASVDGSCQGKASFAALGQMPDTTVLAISNLGSPILAYSGHRVFAGPYHRNIAGNLLALDAFLGSDYRCQVGGRKPPCRPCRGMPGQSRKPAFRRQGAGRLSSRADAWQVPEWLEPVADTKGAPLELYRVRPNG